MCSFPFNEALPGGYLFPCSPEINRFVPLFPKIKILISYVPSSPKMPLFLCSLHFKPLFLCSPEINAIVPENPWEGLFDALCWMWNSIGLVPEYCHLSSELSCSINVREHSYTYPYLSIKMHVIKTPPNACVTLHEYSPLRA